MLALDAGGISPGPPRLASRSVDIEVESGAPDHGKELIELPIKLRTRP
jgi:hypothetical protein